MSERIIFEDNKYKISYNFDGGQIAGWPFEAVTLEDKKTKAKLITPRIKTSLSFKGKKSLVTLMELFNEEIEKL